MAYDFSTYKAYLKTNMGRRGDWEDVDGVNMYEVWVKSAVSWLTTKNRFWKYKINFYFPEIEGIDTDEVTVADQAWITEPSDVYVIHEIFDRTSNQPLNWMHAKSYIRIADRATSSAYAAPLKWTRMDGKVYFWPTADAAYSLDILRRKYVTAMSAATSVSGIGQEWDDAIVHLSTHIGCTAAGDEERAVRHKDLFMDYVEGTIGIYFTESKAGHQVYGMNPYAKDYEF